jgi:hypothetical protein
MPRSGRRQLEKAMLIVVARRVIELRNYVRIPDLVALLATEFADSVHAIFWPNVRVNGLPPASKC